MGEVLVAGVHGPWDLGEPAVPYVDSLGLPLLLHLLHEVEFVLGLMLLSG